MSSHPERGLLLSLRPKFAEAIMRGRKTIELRRTRPRLAPGSKVLLYASAPRMAIVARARVASIVEDKPANIWRDHQAEVGISGPDFNRYFEGAHTAYGLLLEDVTPLEPLPLAAMRALGVEPPQSWRYVERALFDHLSPALGTSKGYAVGPA